MESTLGKKQVSIKQIIWLAISIVVLKLAYERAYYCVYSSFAYYGFRYEKDLKLYVISWILPFCFLFFLPKRIEKVSFSNTIPLILFYIAFLPGTVLYAFMKADFIVAYLIYFLMIFIYNDLIPKPRIAYKTRLILSDKTVRIIAVFATSIIFFIWGYYSHFRINFNIYDVYDYRAEAVSYSIPLPFTYVYSGMRAAVLPMLTIWCFQQRKYFEMILFGTSEIITFFIDGSKSTLFSLVVAFGVFFLLRRNETRIKVLPWLISVFVLIADFLYRTFNSNFIMNFGVRRSIFEPCLINYFYYDFFSFNPPDLFAQSILRFIGVKSNYSNSIAHIIGLNYFGSVTNGANNGLFSDAYMNLGIIGVFIMPLLLVLLFRILDRAAGDLDLSIIVPAIITTSLSLISSSFFTILLTHGVLLLIVFLTLIRNANSEKRNS